MSARTLAPHLQYTQGRATATLVPPASSQMGRWGLIDMRIYQGGWLVSHRSSPAHPITIHPTPVAMTVVAMASMTRIHSFICSSILQKADQLTNKPSNKVTNIKKQIPLVWRFVYSTATAERRPTIFPPYQEPMPNTREELRGSFY